MSGAEGAVAISGYQYISKPDHRDGTPVKSQWDITFNAECTAFTLGVTSGWVKESSAWSLHLTDGAAAYLGRSAVRGGSSRVQLFVAFFQIADVCHGYPSDPTRSSREVPPNDVRSDWLAKDYLRPAAVRKLGRGLTCKL